MTPSLALLGTSEIILIVAVLALFAVTALGVVALVVWAVRRSQPPATAVEGGPRKS